MPVYRHWDENYIVARYPPLPPSDPFPRSGGASFFVVGRDPAGMKGSPDAVAHPDDDLYDPEHGRYVLWMSPGVGSMKMLEFSQVREPMPGASRPRSMLGTFCMQPASPWHGRSDDGKSAKGDSANNGGSV